MQRSPRLWADPVQALGLWNGVLASQSSPHSRGGREGIRSSLFLVENAVVVALWGVGGVPRLVEQGQVQEWGRGQISSRNNKASKRKDQVFKVRYT